MSDRTGQHRVAVCGIGTTTFGAHPGKTSYELGARALREALRDAGLTLAEVDGLVTHRIADYQRLAELLDWSPRFAMGLQGQGRLSGTALGIATMAVATGAARTVALVYGNSGKSDGLRYGGQSDAYGSGGAGAWFPYGMTSPGAVHAIMFRRHMHLYGTTSEQLAAIPVAFRRHASLNERAVMRKPITVAEHQASRWVVEPLHLLDYCLINDGGVAMIVTRAEHARDLPRPPVYIGAVSHASALAGSTFPPDDFWHRALDAAGTEAMRSAGVAHEDIDGLMAYDNFAPTVLFTLEGLGFCEVGESGSWVQGGQLELGGALPTNTNGGHLSESYMQGWGLMFEAVQQLRGEAGERQIAGAKHILYACASPIVTAAVFASECA